MGDEADYLDQSMFRTAMVVPAGACPFCRGEGTDDYGMTCEPCGGTGDRPRMQRQRRRKKP